MLQGGAASVHTSDHASHAGQRRLPAGQWPHHGPVAGAQHSSGLPAAGQLLLLCPCLFLLSLLVAIVPACSYRPSFLFPLCFLLATSSFCFPVFPLRMSALLFSLLVSHACFLPESVHVSKQLLYRSVLPSFLPAADLNAQFSRLFGVCHLGNQVFQGPAATPWKSGLTLRIVHDACNAAVMCASAT